MYWTNPKTIPRTQIKSPQTRSLCPVIPRNDTVDRSGILSSSSLATAAEARNTVKSRTAADASFGATRIRVTAPLLSGPRDVRDQARARPNKTIASKVLTMTPPCIGDYDRVGGGPYGPQPPTPPYVPFGIRRFMQDSQDVD